MTQGHTGTVIRSPEDADRLMTQIRLSAARLHRWISAQADPLAMLQRARFGPVGFHPVDGRSADLVDQIDRTWTYVVAVAAARQLLRLHPHAGGFVLAERPNDPQNVDVVSESHGLVRAETFAAAIPRHHRKIKQGLVTLSARAETHRYMFFLSPAFPANARQLKFERDGVQVWSVNV